MREIVISAPGITIGAHRGVKKVGNQEKFNGINTKHGRRSKSKQE